MHFLIYCPIFSIDQNIIFSHNMEHVPWLWGMALNDDVVRIRGQHSRWLYEWNSKPWEIWGKKRAGPFFDKLRGHVRAIWQQDKGGVTTGQPDSQRIGPGNRNRKQEVETGNCTHCPRTAWSLWQPFGVQQRSGEGSWCISSLIGGCKKKKCQPCRCFDARTPYSTKRAAETVAFLKAQVKG